MEHLPMATSKSAWGIDLGQCALKALKLGRSDEGVSVEACDVVEHPTILSRSDPADREQLTREALGKFLANHSVTGCHVAASVSGQGSFCRFVKLPPVDETRLPQIVRYEVNQQIPFPIDEVVWRWHPVPDPDGPNIEAGIFALKRSEVTEMLERFSMASLQVDTVQMAPLALYNFMVFDDQLAGDGATLLLDVGADATDMVVADNGRIWARLIQIGGDNFTKALARTFKLSSEKAEKLKRTAGGSKYARQIFQAMRPVFADLVQEIQRSIGYYVSLHRGTEMRKLIALGNGFRLPGLAKFLEKNLNIPVARLDGYNRPAIGAGVDAPAFQQNAPSFAVAYGLALQGLELAEIDSNFVPDDIQKKRRRARKNPLSAGGWFLRNLTGLFRPKRRPGK
jgi:type IV pilus assembly protein PilM